MTKTHAYYARSLIFIFCLLLAGLGAFASLADETHDPKDFRPPADDKEAVAKPMPAACALANKLLEPEPPVIVPPEKKARILSALWQSFKEQNREIKKGAALTVSKPTADRLIECLKTEKIKDEVTRNLIHGLLAAEEMADNDLGIKKLADLASAKGDPAAEDEWIAKAAPHVLALRLALADNKLWIKSILAIHENALSPFRALQLLTKHRNLVEELPGSSKSLAEALAREKLSLSTQARVQVKTELATLGPAFETDLTLLRYLKFLYAADATEVPEAAQTDLTSADKKAGELAEQWNNNLSSVVGADGTIHTEAKLVVSSFTQPDRTLTAQQWLKEQEDTYGRNALIQWAIARGGEQGGRTIVAALKGSNPAANELVVRLPKATPTLKVGELDLHGNDRIQLGLTSPATLAAEAGKILPVGNPGDWDKLRLEAEAAPKVSTGGAVIKVTGERPVRTVIEAPPLAPLSPIVKFGDLVHETEWSAAVPPLSIKVADPSLNTRSETAVFLGKPTSVGTFSPKNPPLLAAVLKDIGEERLVPLGPNADSPAIVGFDSTQKILIVRENSGDRDWFYSVPFDHYENLSDPKAPPSLTRRFSEKRTVAPSDPSHPWNDITGPKAGKEKIKISGEDPRKELLLLTPAKRIVDRSLPLAKLKATIEKEKSQVAWAQGSGYFFGFNDEKQVLYMTFDGFDDEDSERTVFTIPYKEYTEIIIPKKD